MDLGDPRPKPPEVTIQDADAETPTGGMQKDAGDLEEVDDGRVEDDDEEHEEPKDPNRMVRPNDYRDLDGLLRQCGPRQAKFRAKMFWPPPLFNRIMTYDRIMEELSSYTELDPNQIEAFASAIHSDCRVIFAVLCLMSTGPLIISVIKERITDSDLPLKPRKRNSDPHKVLYRNVLGSQPVKVSTFGDWSPHSVESFIEYQYQLRPVYLEMEDDGRTAKHFALDEKQILPITEIERGESGSYGIVQKVKLHESGHGFHSILTSIETNNQFALKESLDTFRTTKEERYAAFEREKKSLMRFNGFQHPHLVTLLATWTVNDSHSLLFPCAMCDLDLYWTNNNPNPTMDVQTVRWISKQVRGLAGALYTIHEPPNDALLPPNEHRFGRHGDLKPENILCFASPVDKAGIWVIADLGLASLNRALTRSNIPNRDIQGTPRYKPPECDLEGGTVSRSYDIWTFGCLLLELVIWALRGEQGRQRFLEELMKPYVTGSQSDRFFDIRQKESGGYVVLVKEEVNEWISNLHASPKCTDYFHNLLDLIEDDMIVLLALGVNRISSKKLKSRIEELHEHVKNSKTFATTPTPVPRVTKRCDPVDAEFRSKKNEAIEKVTLKIYKGDSRRSKSKEELEAMGSPIPN